MQLTTIFEKPIDRHIEGVIKADDDASLLLEVEEYVLTNEVAKRLEGFLYAYNNYEDANGVWISGFFGSGKSHLLKMLAFLLENRVIEDEPVLDLFSPKCGDNEILRADLQRAASIPSKSILFNIDQKADVISKSEIDALLAVFVKVFDEMCGYYGKQGHIAQFERDLDSRGEYGAFKKAYKDISGLEWEFGREQALLEGPNIASAYAQVSGQPQESAKNILDKYRDEYKVSIEDFAEQVNDYINQQGPNFRLNFFVDEVGQYIAESVKLMTNLQTIAESLATKCRGRSWLIVTAQEDMDTVLGEFGKQQSIDFSKIQDRFNVRMKLTSADVSEVIRRRLLLKNDRGIGLLSDVYTDQYNNFRTLFDFADGSQTYRNFRDRDEFIHSYPFIPYQYVLFQSAIQSLSMHNAFEGKHRSVGERSMLAVFQEVVIQIRDHEVGELATFDLMFEGIRSALKSNVQFSILTAEKHLRNPFAITVLKALFLVKYVKEFKATVRNLTVLMIEGFDTDLPAQRERLEGALNILEQQTYIQRNAEEYEYLTDEEKDVEEEIKNTPVESAAVADELGQIVFDNVIKQRKIRFDENGQDYPYARKLDDRLLSRDYELAIHVISPFHEHTENVTILRAQSMGRDELFILMPASDRLVRDLLLYKKTEKYIRQKMSIGQPDATRRILTDKQFGNAERLKGLRTLTKDLMGQALLIVGGREVEEGTGDAQSRIVRGFHDLVVRTYTNLNMLRGITYTENDIANCLKPTTTLYGSDRAMVSEPEQEMLSFVQSNNRGGLRTTMQTLDNRFEHKPYGWHLAAIQCTLAKLISRGKIEVRRDGNLLEEEDELEQALRNTHGYANLVLDPQIEFTAVQVRWLKEFYGDFFDAPPSANEAKTLGQETGAAFQSLQEIMSRLQADSAIYPFLSVLDEPVSRLKEMSHKPYAFYLTELRQYEDGLFDLKEQVLDPIRNFMSGQQKQIYDEARQFLQIQEPNLPYAGQDEADQIQAILAEPTCYSGNLMAKVKTLLDNVQDAVAQRVDGEKSKAAESIEERWERLANTTEYDDLTVEKQSFLRKPFGELDRTVERQALIAVIRDTVRQFDLTIYPQLLNQMTLWAQPAAEIETKGTSTDGHETVVNDLRVEYVTQPSLQVAFNKPWLADEEDVERYLKALKEAMIHVIDEGKRIQI